MKRWWLKALIGLGVLVLLLWLSFLGSGVRSKNAVERYRDQLRAAGEKVDLKDVIPTPASNQVNAAALFLEANSHLRSGGSDVLSTNTPYGMRMVSPGKAMIVWQQPYWGDSSGSNSWDEVAAALATRSKGIELLVQIPTEGKLDFQPDYTKGPTMMLQHLPQLKSSAQILSSSVLYHLQAGSLSEAFTNIQALLRLVNGCDDERTVISELVRIAIIPILHTAQWELLQSTNLTDNQLIELQKHWRRLEFVVPMENALLMEGATASLTFDYLRNATNLSAAYGFAAASTTTGSSGWLDGVKELAESTKDRAGEALWRGSWSFKDELHYLQGNQVLIESLRQVQTNTAFLPALADRDRKLAALGIDNKTEQWLRQTLNAHGYLSIDSLGKLVEKVLVAETTRQLVLAAIALKRFELRHGRLPDALSTLVPDFLSSVPIDPADGKPLRYRRNPDGTFLLYSIGENGKDDGGDPSRLGASKSFSWSRGQDWVWPQPATAAEIQAYRITEAGNP